jgi:hypothetical protein
MERLYMYEPVFEVVLNSNMPASSGTDDILLSLTDTVVELADKAFELTLYEQT